VWYLIFKRIFHFLKGRPKNVAYHCVMLSCELSIYVQVQVIQHFYRYLWNFKTGDIEKLWICDIYVWSYNIILVGYSCPCLCLLAGQKCVILSSVNQIPCRSADMHRSVLVILCVILTFWVTTCLENLVMSGNYTDVREMSGISLKVMEMPRNC